MPTANTIVTRTGTNFTVNVTACDLDPDTTLKDFIVLHNSTAVSNISYTKTTATTLTYTGVALDANTTVEVRRKTPSSVILPMTYARKLSSDLYNRELQRKTRWQEEVDLNGAGSTSVALPIPRDETYGVSWNGDTIYPPTRNAVYQRLEALAPMANPSFTGIVTIPAVGLIESSTRALAHQDAALALSTKANLTSPVFTGTPNIAAATAITPSVSSDSTQVATTAWVKSWYFADRPLVVAGQTVSLSAGVTTTLTINWNVLKQAGGLTIGADKVIRTNSNGWYAISVRVEEQSGFNDYSVIQCSVAINTPTTPSMVGQLFRRSGLVGNFIENGYGVYPLTWNAALGADRHVYLQVIQTNPANAARTFNITITVERLTA